MKPPPQTEAPLANRAQAALLASISHHWQKARDAASEAATIEVSAMNLLRIAGIQLQEANGGRQQIQFEFLERHRDALPKDFTFKAAKFCVHLAMTFPGEIKELGEVRAARQLMFEAFGQVEAPRRIEAQHAHESNPFSVLVSGAATFMRYIADVEAEPMEDWGRAALEKFVSTTKPIAEKHKAAVTLLVEKAATHPRHD